MPQNDAVQDDLAAGRELDALIEERVFGRCSHPDDRVRIVGRPGDPWKHCDKCGQAVNGIPSQYSTDISAAWTVLDEMVWRVGTANIRLDMEDYGRGARTTPTGAERRGYLPSCPQGRLGLVCRCPDPAHAPSRTP